MKKYVLYDAIININKTLPLVNSTKELFKFLNLKVPVLKNASRDLGCDSIGIDCVGFHEANAKNLALASKENSHIVCVEDSSFLSLNLTLEELKKDEKFRRSIEETLAKEELELDLNIEILTLAEFLLEVLGKSKIQKKVINSFEKFMAALYLGSYQCQIHKYSNTNAYSDILNVVNLKLVNYNLKNQVSGYDIYDLNEELSLKMSGNLMLDMFDNAADFVVVNDARSFVMFDDLQKDLEKKVGREIGLSVFGLAEILLLAFGMSDKAKIGLNDHAVKTNMI